MFRARSIQSSLSIKDKILSIDYILVISIFILGLISILAMYSTDGGELKYHTKSHILRFFVFFIMFLTLSFIQIRFWHSQSYLIYFLFFILLLGVKYFGLTSSGSKRWLDLYFMNLQPSELVIAGASSDGVGMSIRGHEDYFKSLVFGGTTSDRDAVVSYSSTSQNKMTIGTTRASGIINFVTGNGDVSFTLSGGASGVISGSATSTGSFGSLILADKIQGDVTVGGNLIVEGDTIQQQVANLNIEDRFILLNSGSASGDGGLIVQTESHTAGVVYGYDDDESRWGFQQGTKLSATGSAIAPDAYASAVVTSDDANYQKNGNIRVEGGEIYIYVE